MWPPVRTYLPLAAESTVMDPLTPHLFSMTWRRGLFVHWPFDPDRVRPHVPEPLELDTRDGRAWISVLPFVLARVGLRGSPGAARLTFPEVNVRTYVRVEDTPGLYFFDIDVGHPLVARLVRATTRLPCHEADATVRTRGEEVTVRSVRVRTPDDREGPAGRLHATYRPEGEVYHAEPGTVDHWLVERRRLYDPTGRGVLYGEIAHDRWPLRRTDATVHHNTLFEAGDLPAPERDPRMRYCGSLAMTGSVPRLIRPT